MFKIIKVQHSNPVTYLLEDYRGKYSWSVLRIRVVSHDSSGYIPHGESIAQEGKRGLRKVTGIR